MLLLYVYVFRADCLVLDHLSQGLKHLWGHGPTADTALSLSHRPLDSPLPLLSAHFAFPIRSAAPPVWSSDHPLDTTPDISFPSPIFVSLEYSQQFISVVCSTGLFVNSSKGAPFLLSLCPCVCSAPDSKQVYSGYPLEQMREEAQWLFGDWCIAHWGISFSGFPLRTLSTFFFFFLSRKKNLEESRKTKNVIIHLLFFVSWPQISFIWLIILFLPSWCLLSVLVSFLLSPVEMKAGPLCVPSRHCPVCQANPQRCLATPGSLDTTLMDRHCVGYRFISHRVIEPVVCEVLCWLQEKLRNECHRPPLTVAFEGWVGREQWWSRYPGLGTKVSSCPGALFWDQSCLSSFRSLI